MKDGGRKTKNYTKQVSVTPSYSAKDDCDFNFITQLTNVEVGLDHVKVGDFLSVEVFSGATMVALNQLGEICGYLQSPHDRKLLDCISKGTQYRARVMHTKPGVTIQKVK